MDRPVAARRRWTRRARRARLVLYAAGSIPAVPLSGWPRAGRAHHRRGDHGHGPPRYTPGSGPAGTMAAALDRAALLRHLPVALARLHGHPTRSGCVHHRGAVADPASGSDARARRPLLPLRRNTNPPRRFRTGLEDVARGERGPALVARRR